MTSANATCCAVLHQTFEKRRQRPDAETVFSACRTAHINPIKYSNFSFTYFIFILYISFLAYVLD